MVLTQRGEIWKCEMPAMVKATTNTQVRASKHHPQEIEALKRPLLLEQLQTDSVLSRREYRDLQLHKKVECEERE